MKAENPVLDLRGLAIGYRKGRRVNVVAEDITATLESGELVALIGRNGAGKSTLLRTLSAYIAPIQGNALYNGSSVAEMTQTEIARQISVVLTESVKSAMTVRELVSMGRVPHTNFIGHMTHKDKQAVDRALNTMGVASLEQRSIETLSDGERQKCMIAKALAQETPLMLLDEPTAFLDFGSKVGLYKRLKALSRDENKAILVSTHDLELALKLADRLWIMNNGKLFAGTADELASNGALQEFVGDTDIKYNNLEKRIEIL